MFYSIKKLNEPKKKTSLRLLYAKSFQYNMYIVLSHDSECWCQVKEYFKLTYMYIKGGGFTSYINIWRS